MSPPRSTDAAPNARTQQFDALVDGYGRLVAQAVRQVASSVAANDLEDIRQEVMLALWRRLDAEQTIDHPSSYLYTAAIREAVRAVGRARRRAEAPLEATPVEPRVAASAENTVMEQERRVILDNALQALAPERARAVRAYLAGLSVEEMMHLYGWTYQRARNLLARAVSDLKTSLRPAS